MLPVVLVAAGPLVVSRRRLVATLGGVLGCWTVGAVVSGPGAGAGAPGLAGVRVGLLAACAAGAALHIHAARNLARGPRRSVRSRRRAVRDDLTGCLNPQGLAHVRRPDPRVRTTPG